MISGLLIADGGVVAGLAASELGRSDSCVQRDGAGGCIQTQSLTSDYRLEMGLLVAGGAAIAIVGVVLAFMADDYFRQLGRVRGSASLDGRPWASFDGRTGALGWVMRW